MSVTQPLCNEGEQKHLEDTESEDIPASRRAKAIFTVISWIKSELLTRAEVHELVYRDGPAGKKDRARIEELYLKWKTWEI